MHKIHLMLLLVTIAACNSNSDKTPLVKSTNDVLTLDSVSNEEDVLKSFQVLLTDEPQHFIVAANTIKTIVAKKGLKVTVDPAVLENPDGTKVSGDIEVIVKEMQKPEEMIANNCATVSDGRLLSSGGSYYVGMKCNGQELRIRKGYAVQMEFPKIYKKGMELFYGERTADGMMNWKRADIKLNEQKEIEIDEGAVEITTGTTGRSSYFNSLVEKTEDSINIDPTKGYKYSIQWLRAFEELEMNKRKEYVKTNHEKMSQDQIRAVMQKPIKISRKDIARLRIKFSYWPYQKNTEVHLTEDIAYFFEERYMRDSMIYYKDSIKYAAGEIDRSKTKPADSPSPFLTTSYNYNVKNDIDVDISANTYTESKTVKKSLVRYYDPVGVTNLGWLNCDRYYITDLIPQYAFEFKGEVPSDIGIYAIFRGINSMLSHRVKTKGKSNFVVTQNIPLNTQVEFLIYSKINGEFVESKYSTTVTKNMVVPIVFNKVPEKEIKKVFLNKNKVEG